MFRKLRYCTTPYLSKHDVEHAFTALQIVKSICARLNLDHQFSPVYNALFKVKYCTENTYFTSEDNEIIIKVLSAPINERNIFKRMYLTESFPQYARGYAKLHGMWDQLITLKGN